MRPWLRWLFPEPAPGWEIRCGPLLREFAQRGGLIWEAEEVLQRYDDELTEAIDLGLVRTDSAMSAGWVLTEKGERLVGLDQATQRRPPARGE